MRWNIKGAYVVRLPFEMLTLHVPGKGLPVEQAKCMLLSQIQDAKHPWKALRAILTDVSEDVPEVEQVLVAIDSISTGDPAECHCSQCTRPCRHEPDPSTLRHSGSDLCVDVQCRLCGQWGSFGFDPASVQFEESAQPATWTRADYIDAVAAGDVPAGMGYQEWRKAMMNDAIETGQSWEPETEAPADTSTLPGVKDVCRGSRQGCSCGAPGCDEDPCLKGGDK